MTKALMIHSGDVAIATTRFANLIGGSASTSTESKTQIAATQGAAFTQLGFNVISGGSGVNTCTFRDAGAAGQNVASRTGTGIAADTTHTDTLTAGDLFTLQFTDTGTDPAHSWVKANVEFASGHGSFHGCSAWAGVVQDAASETRYFGLAGSLPADGLTTEANVAFKNRAYDTWAALQVTVQANARTNNSVFKNRINGADGTGIVTFGASVTGLLQDTAVGDAIADGNTIAVSLTLLTGVEDLTTNQIIGTFTSSTVKSESWISSIGSTARAGSATASYLPLGGHFSNLLLTEAQARIPVGFDGTASNLRCYLSANTYTDAATLKLIKNGTAVLTTAIGAGGGAGWYENTVDSVSFVAADELSFEFDEGTSGSITIYMVGVTLSAGAGAPQTYEKSVAETLAAVETQTGLGIFGKSVAEALAAVETQTVAKTSVGAIAEILAAVETQTGLGVLVGARTEALSAIETQTGLGVFNKSVTETLTAVETITGLGIFGRSVAETLAAIEAQTGLGIFGKSVAEVLAAIESQDGTVVPVGGQTYNESRDEILTAVDTQSATQILIGNEVEVLSAVATQNSILITSGNRAEVLTIAETQSSNLIIDASVNEVLTAAETQSSSLTVVSHTERGQVIIIG